MNQVSGMRILYVCPDYGIPVLGSKGGAVHVRAMVAAFARTGHDVLVAAPRAMGSVPEEAAELAGRFVPLPMSNATNAVHARLGEYMGLHGLEGSLPRDVRYMLHDLDLRQALRRLVVDEEPGFIYARASLFSSAAVAVSQETGRPLLMEVNAPLAAEQAKYRGGALHDMALAVERKTVTEADAVLAVSQAVREHVLALGAKPERVHVFPNGVDLTRFHPARPDSALRRRLGLGDGPVIGFVGGLRPWHGVESLPELLARLVPHHPETQLLIVGDGPLRSDVENALTARGVRERAVLTGTMPHAAVPDAIRLLDVALAPYPALEHDFYFSPLKLFEYMACGVAVAVPHIGQIRGVIDDGETGLLYEAGNLDALVAVCDRLLQEDGLRRRLGAAGARLVAEHYTWDGNARRAVELARRIAEMRAERT
jgi:glycosyltransferase involved in cell wall biosynthesis